METPLSESEERALLAIAQQMENGDDVPLQLQLKYLHWREKTLSAQIADDPDAYPAHVDILAQIAAINEKIMNSGDLGGGTTGQASVRDTRNNPR